jgi:hypothetical protein
MTKYLFFIVLIVFVNTYDVINWMGYNWILKDSQNKRIAPGKNLYIPSNVQVDHNGYLHLKIKSIGYRIWTCA